MKRALALTFAALLFGVAGLAQISGSFSGELTLLPAVALDSVTLSLVYSVAGFDITGTTEFDSTGWVNQKFELTGTFGPASVEGSMSFLPSGEKVLKDITYSYVIPKDYFAPGDPATDFTVTWHDEKWAVEGPAYLSSSLSLSMDFAGVMLGLEITHEANKMFTFELCDGFQYFYYDRWDYDVQTTSDSVTFTATPGQKWIDATECCYAKYFVTGDTELLLAKVTVKGVKDGKEVTYVIEGPFEVLSYDPEDNARYNPDNTIYTGMWYFTLTQGAYDYIYWIIISELLDPTKEGWDDVTDVVFDPADLSLKILLPSYMTYTFTAEVEPVSVEVVLDDVCTGIQFKEATITLTDLSLCCGITYDAELHFTKCEGFDYIKFSADLFELCCDISFGVDVTFGVDYKKVKPKFSWAGIEGCVTVWGDVQEKVGEVGVEGWELYGYKIFCELAECYSLEFVTAFNVSKVEDIIGDVFKGDEFEYISIGACGPACCGGTWTLDATIYFDNAGGLFGISRFAVDTEVPIMDALTLSFSFESPDTISVGWEFTF